MLNVRGNLAVCRAIRSAYGSHAWVIDGYMERHERKIRVGSDGSRSIEKENVRSQQLVHCNWGWGGSCDGYYVSGAFNLKNGPTETEPGDDDRNRNYDWWMRTLSQTYVSSPQIAARAPLCVLLPVENLPENSFGGKIRTVTYRLIFTIACLLNNI